MIRHRGPRSSLSLRREVGESSTILPPPRAITRSAKASAVGQIVRGEDHRLRLFAHQRCEELHDLVAGLRIEARGRLIGQHDIGVLHQGAGDRHALRLAARQLVGALAGHGGKAHAAAGSEAPPGGWPAGQVTAATPCAQVPRLRAMHDIGEGREPAHQIVLLEDEADAGAEAAQLPARAHHVGTQNADAALVRLDQPRNAAQQASTFPHHWRRSAPRCCPVRCAG